VWLGTTVPYKAFTFLFKQTPRGMFRVHAYRYAEASSTFIVECTPETWRAYGFDTADEDRTIAALSEVFADELAGHPLIKNRSIWRNFPTVRCARWHTDNVVLVGDAAHTAHFSIGSGTKLAMEDVIVLRDELLATHDVTAALAAYEARRRPEVEALQAAAQASLEWFEGTERYMKMSPAQFTYSLMTRSLRVSHTSVAKRDPHLATGVEAELAVTAGVPPTKPTALPFQLGRRRARSRLAVAAHFPPGPPALTPAAAITIPPWITSLASPEVCDRWRDLAQKTHHAGGLIAARLHISSQAAAFDPSVAAGVVRADFDLVILDQGQTLSEELPARVAALADQLQDHCWIAATVADHPSTRAAVLGHVAQLVRAGAQLIWVKAHADGNARLPAAPLADRIRNELGVATMIDGSTTMMADLDAAIAAGRADLIAVAP
jgi:anthraniloyl-CoA monooxygenase